MNEKRVDEIVWKVFEKAKNEHASHSRFALANHVSLQSSLSSKTLERAHDRYIKKNGKHGQLNAESIDLICKFIGFANYADYIKRNPLTYKGMIPRKREKKKAKWFSISINIAF